MAVKYEVSAVTGKYTDRDGNEKSRYVKLGVVIESKNGLMLKCEAIPVGWDGWAYLNEPRARDESRPAQRQEPRPAPSRQDHNDYAVNGSGDKHADASNGFVDDSDIPFAPIPRRQLW